MAAKSFIDLVPNDKKGLLPSLKMLFEDYMAGKLEETEYKDHVLPPFFPKESTQYIHEEWNDIKESDVFMCSYPKTGTAWTLEILKNILTLSDPDLAKLLESFPPPFRLLEMGPPESIKLREAIKIPCRRFVGSHLSAELFPVERVLSKGAKIIYIMRNPKDQAVSWYHFSRKVQATKGMKKLYPDNFQEFLNLYCSGQQATFCKRGEWYPHHLLAWNKFRGRKNIKFLYYEDMKEDFPREILGIAEFLDIALTRQQAEQIAHNCSFNTMKKVTDEGEADIDRFRRASGLMRKGTVGNWKEYFTVSQSESMDRELTSHLAGSGISFQYELKPKIQNGN